MKVLNTHEAAAVIGLSASLLNKLRCHGGGPRYIKLGRAVRYDAADLHEWITCRKRAHTNDNTPASAGRAA